MYTENHKSLLNGVKERPKYAVRHLLLLLYGYRVSVWGDENVPEIVLLFIQYLNEPDATESYT